MQTRNRLVLTTVTIFGALAAATGLALLGGGQVFASDAVGKIIQPPAMRAIKPLTDTQNLPPVTSNGQPVTHTIILPLVRQQANPQNQSTPVERIPRKLVLPPVTPQPNRNRQATAPPKVAATCTDVIQNAGFEAAAPGKPWSSVANLAYSRAAESFITSIRAHAGKQSARIGSPALANYWSEVIQTVELPQRTTGVTLTYWRYLDMPAASGARAADSFTAGIETEQGIQMVAPQKIDVTTRGRGAWVKSTLTLPNAGAYSGKRLWVTFKGRTGARYPATLYIDDVQLSVCAIR